MISLFQFAKKKRMILRLEARESEGEGLSLSELLIDLGSSVVVMRS